MARHGKKSKKWPLVVLCTLLALLAAAALVYFLFFSPGWHRDGGGSYYIGDGGRASGFLTIEGSTYYFENGYPHTGWLPRDGGQMYFDAQGIRQTGEVTVDGALYRIGEDGLCRTGLFEQNGTRYLWDAYGFALSGVVEYQGNTYCLASDGAVQVGWQEGYYYLPTGERAAGLVETEDGTYYFDESGAAITGWHTVEGITRYFDGNGKQAQGFFQVEGQTYYFLPSGEAAKGETVIDGETYYFTQEGILYQGFRTVDGVTYGYDRYGKPAVGLLEWEGVTRYFDENSIMQTSCVYEGYFVNAQGIATPIQELLDTDQAEEYLAHQLAVLRKQFPAGMYWNHVGYTIPAGEEAANYVTNTPCVHEPGSRSSHTCNYVYSKFCLSYHNSERGSQCLGFCAMISDILFGEDAPIRTFTDFDSVRIGDCIRLGGNLTHSLVVVGKTDQYVEVAEVNRDYETCKIGWGRKIYRYQLDSAAYETVYITRYTN